ncbi:MAG TPA: 4a-hydroxytetrahydrobiopterin dehydratase [Candidatus Paceibacterota bacterium]|nr:4a-hydroxytetrahydrobiopterin dehydratase [Candidatus Paceibacterota bacterium]
MASKLAKKKCVPCEGGVKPLTEEAAQDLMKELDPEWALIDEAHILARGFHFKDFKKTMVFVNKVAAIAEEEQHHPDLTISYGDVGVELTTHAIHGLSENDFILAAKIDMLGA